MNQTSPPPPPPTPGRRLPPALLAALALGALVAVGTGAYLLGRHRSAGPVDTSDQGATASNQGGLLQALPPVSGEPQPMEPPAEAQEAALWVDVYAPAKVRAALAKNAWLTQQLQAPLGRGFVGGWAAFLGTRGEDLGASFKGAVLDLLAEQVLASPFRLLWLSGDARNGTPVLLLPEPERAAIAAYESLRTVSRRNALLAKGCPGGQGTVPAEGFRLERLLVAEQSVWAARAEDRLVLGRTATSVLQGLSAALPVLEAPAKDVDVELGFAPEPLGRELQLLSHVAGLEGTTLRFGVEGERLVARGLAGRALKGERRLDAAPLSESLLKLTPEETPVLLAVQLRLPESLEPEALKAFWSGEGAAPRLRTREVALLWTPRGSAEAPTEVALVWGRPEDGPALERLFSGPNALVRAPLCGHLVLASTPAVLERMRRACEGRSPSLLHASAPLVRGLREKGSVAFGVNTGRLLGGLLADGYAAGNEAEGKKPARAAPPEIEAARRELETLPYVGLRGTLEGNTLKPEGFGS